MKNIELYNLDNCIVESVEYFRKICGLSLYGILHRINCDNQSDLEFYSHAQKVLKYFNDFDNKTDDDNFMKCLLGLYKIK